MDAFSDFNIYDLIIVAVLVIGILRGLTRGLSGELAALIALALAVAAAWYLYEPVGDYLAQAREWTMLQAHTVAIVVVILLALLVLFALGALLKKIMSFAFKGWLERIGGAVLGFVRFGIIAAAVIFLIHLHGREPMKEMITEESLIGRHTMETMRPWYDQLAERYPELRRIEPDDYPEYEQRQGKPSA